jgi:hypothetical protein
MFGSFSASSPLWFSPTITKTLCPVLGGGGVELGGAEEVGGADEVGGSEEVGGADDVGGAEEVGGADDVGGAEEVGGADDVGGADEPVGTMLSTNWAGWLPLSPEHDHRTVLSVPSTKV